MRNADATARLRAVSESQSTAQLTAALDDSSPEVARAAIRRLSEHDGAIVADELRARLLSCDLSLVRDIAGGLRRLGDRRAGEIAIAGLTEEPYTRRLAAARALGVLGGPEAIAPLRATLEDQIAGVRIAALDALGRIGAGPDAETAEACARLLADPLAQVRIAAVRTVAVTAAEPGSLLAAAAGDEDRLVRLELARHTAALPKRAAAALLADPELRVREAAALAAGTREAPILGALLTGDDSIDVRHAAAKALGGLGDQHLADLLVPALEDRDAIVRMATVRALEQLLTDAGAARRLCRELAHGRPERRRATLYALANLDASAAAAGEITRLADDPDPDVRLALIHTADTLIVDAEPVISGLAADADATVRNAAEMWLLRHSSSVG